jgi:DNA invertase Pin-like site-specific DNA recombinase
MKTITQFDNSSHIWGYIRVSTDKQALSVEAQLKLIQDYCAVRQLVLLGYTVDEDSSATKTLFFSRPKVQLMLREEMPAKNCKHLIITKTDRAFRNTMDGLFTADELRNQGISVTMLDMQIDTSTPEGELMFTTLLGIARFESRRRSARQKETFTAMKSSNKLTGQVRFGWDMVIDDTRETKNPSRKGTRDIAGDQAFNVVPNEEEQFWLRKIMVEWAAESDCEVARRLNQKRVLAKKGGKWYPATVASVRKHGKLAPQSSSGDSELPMAA